MKDAARGWTSLGVVAATAATMAGKWTRFANWFIGYMVSTVGAATVWAVTSERKLIALRMLWFGIARQATVRNVSSLAGKARLICDRVATVSGGDVLGVCGGCCERCRFDVGQ